MNNNINLRDYFAGLALQAMIGMVNKNTDKDDIDLIPQGAYFYADLMLKERRKGEEEKYTTLLIHTKDKGIKV